MKILLLGATGRTGKHLLQEALAQGHIVHALVRDKGKLYERPDNLFVFEGIPTDSEVLKHAMKGCEAILSVLNISRTSDFPWAKLRTPGTFLSDTIKAVATIANEAHIKRIIVCSAWGTNETKQDIPGWFRWLINNSNIGVTYRDHEVQETYLQHTTFDYTVVRPVGLTNSGKQKQVVVTINNSPKPRLTISRKNVAAFMLDCLQEHSFIRQSVTISER